MRRESQQSPSCSDWTIRAISLAMGIAVVAYFAVPIANPAQAQTSSAASAPAAKTSSQSAQVPPNCKTFSSPQAAADALYKAAHDNDENGLLVILGPGAKDIVMWTDDPAERNADMQMFVKKYDQMHRFVKEPDNETTLYVGAENWPLPVPLVQHAGVWYFDASLGRREILFRRIGGNEMETVDTLRAMADAENDYFSRDTNSSGVHEYTRKFECSAGSHDGLYWPTSGSDETSPAGPLVARACYDNPEHVPFRGYYFRILTEQGPKAPGGVRNYVVDGKMTGGFAILAFPAQYRVSGVKSFVVGMNGVVYEKDLGPTTLKLAPTVASFNPDATWSKVQ